MLLGENCPEQLQCLYEAPQKQLPTCLKIRQDSSYILLQGTARKYGQNVEGRAKAAVQWARQVLEGEYLCRRGPAAKGAHGLQHVGGSADGTESMDKVR